MGTLRQVGTTYSKTAAKIPAAGKYAKKNNTKKLSVRGRKSRRARGVRLATAMARAVNIVMAIVISVFSTIIAVGLFALLAVLFIPLGLVGLLLGLINIAAVKFTKRKQRGLNFMTLAIAGLILLPSKQVMATVKNGFYLTPVGGVIFVNKSFIKGARKDAIGGGGGFALGYQFEHFQFQLETGYQYYHPRGTYSQVELTAETFFTSRQTIQTISFDNNEGFIPITFGINYTISLTKNDNLRLTPGVAGGLWIHTIASRLSSDTPFDYFLANQPDFLNYKITEYRGLIMPSLSLDYAPTDNLTIKLLGKFYLVPGGYSDYYNQHNIDLAPCCINWQNFNSLWQDHFTPSYEIITGSFWYGAFDIGLQYVF
ncbi:MAG: hypothetical protein QM529_03630 [Hydrotalea sp.]|nr:hypothetical protein [Hydrotalea sp.]